MRNVQLSYFGHDTILIPNYSMFSIVKLFIAVFCDHCVNAPCKKLNTYYPLVDKKISFFHYCNACKVEFGFTSFSEKLVQTNTETLCLYICAVLIRKILFKFYSPTSGAQGLRAATSSFLNINSKNKRKNNLPSRHLILIEKICENLYFDTATFYD